MSIDGLLPVISQSVNGNVAATEDEMTYLIGYQDDETCPECGSGAIEFAERMQMYAVIDGNECKVCGHWWPKEDDWDDFAEERAMDANGAASNARLDMWNGTDSIQKRIGDE